MTAHSASLTTITGRIQALRRAAGTVNLLEDMQKGAFATGLAAAVSGQAGIVANAASLALYDGEDVEHIALLINGQLAVGTFEWLEDIEVDDEVKLVVSQIEDGPLFIHAILREKDQLLWMPYQCASGRKELALDMLKICGLILLLTWAFFVAYFLVSGDMPERLGAYFLFGGGPMLMFFVGYMSLRSSLSSGELVEQIFAMLGVPFPSRFKVMPWSLQALDTSKGYNSLSGKQGFIFDFTAALAAHKKKFRLA
jgi:hypothetical protein